MRRRVWSKARLLTVWALVLTLAGLTSLGTPRAVAQSQPPDPSVYVDPAPVVPDVAYTLGSGRIEVYTSIGDNDGGVDWRPMNAFAWLLSSVPKGQYIRTTIYNTYQDMYGAQFNADTNKWEVTDPSGKVVNTMFSVSRAIRDQLNAYSTPDERKAHVMAIGQRDAILLSKQNGSSLADLLVDSGVTKLCTKPGGACVSDYAGMDMHSKFALLSQAKDSTGKVWSDVTFVTTANTNGQSGGKTANTVVVVYGDQNLYNGMINNVWNPMMQQKATAGYWTAAGKGIVGSLPGVVYYPSPRALGADGKPLDFEFLYLRDRMVSNGGPKKTACTVRIVQSMFSSGRQGIGNALQGLKKDGCKIQVVLDKDFVLDLASSYFAMSEWLKDIIGNIRYQNVHDKTMTVTYTAAGVTSKAAFTGSANYNAPGLRADESVIKVSSAPAVDAISLHADRMYAMAKYPSSIPVASVTLDSVAPSLMVGTAMKLTASVAPSNASNKTIRWESTNPSIASVTSDGTVTAVSPGTANIRARSLQNGVEGIATVTVYPSTLVPAPSILSAPASVLQGATATLSVGWTNPKYAGTVTMQYFDAATERWVDADPVAISSGKGTFTYPVIDSRRWRVKTTTITSPSDATLSESTNYSTSTDVLARGAASATPSLSAPAKFVSGSQVSFSASWASPYAPARPSVLALQYQNGSTWTTKQNVTIPSGKTYADFKLAVSSTHVWRVVPTTASLPSGVKPTPSPAVTVTRVAGPAVATPSLSGPSTFKPNTVVKFTAKWASSFPTLPARLDVQYKNGSTWVTKTSVTISKGKTSVGVSMKLTATHDWRVQVASVSVPAGANRPASASIRVTAKK